MSSFQGRTLSVAAPAGAMKPTPSAKPPPAVSAVATNWRRERVVSVIMVPSRSRAHQSCCAMHRAAEPLIGAATADIGEIGVDIGVGRVRIGLEIGRRRHDLAGLAVTALRDLFAQPRLLHRMLAVGREPLDSGDLLPCDGSDRHRAGANGLAVHMHGASAALGDAAAEFRSGQSELLPQDPEKRRIVLDIELMRGPVDVDVDHDVQAPEAAAKNYTKIRSNGIELLRSGAGKELLPANMGYSAPR